MSLTKKIKDYYKIGKKLLFTTPSHAQGDFIIPCAKKYLGNVFFKNDFSEIEGFDNLRAPGGILKQLQENIAEIYDAKYSFMLTNGSTSGILAAMLAVLKENDKVLIARNCHVSVYNGIVLTGAKPLWFLPEYDKEWGLFKGLKANDLKDYFINNKDIKAVIITSPTYEGLFSNIEEIAQLCRKNNALLIVDEAHGALMNFGNFKAKPAIVSGADISIQSLHKTAGAPNPCALLHISKQSDIAKETVQDCLNLINTTSPSYPLLCAIEACVVYLNSAKGRKHIEQLLKNIDAFRGNIPDYAEVYDGFNDPSKLLVKLKNKNNILAAEILNDKFNIEEEFSTSDYMLFVTGIGTNPKKLNTLSNALKKTYRLLDDYSKINHDNVFTLPKIHLTPKEALNAEFETIATADSAGRTCAEMIVSYPPGIPVLFPGEKITLDSLFKIKEGEKDQIKVLK